MKVLSNRFCEIFALVVTCMFQFLWVYAATSKLLDYQTFKVQIGQSPLLMPASWLIPWLIPSVEFALSLMLFFRRFRLTGLYLSVGLMSMFTAYIIVMLRFSDYVPCSCGGILQKMTWNQHLLFNISFLVLGTAAVVAGYNTYFVATKQGQPKTCIKE